WKEPAATCMNSVARSASTQACCWVASHHASRGCPMSRQGNAPCSGVLRLLFLVLLLAGCAGTGTLPEEQYYRLATLGVDAPFAQAPVAAVLYVERIEAVSLFRDRALLYGAADNPQQLQRHHYHYWAGSPPQLVRDQLV